MLSVMLKQISVLVAFAGFVSCQPKDVDGWSKVIKWGMTIEEAKAAFGSDAPGQISNVGTFLVKHVEIGSLIIDVTVWSKQHVVSSVQMTTGAGDESFAGAPRMYLCSFVLAVLEVPRCTRAAIALSGRVVSRRSRAAISSLAGSFLRRVTKSSGCQP